MINIPLKNSVNKNHIKRHYSALTVDVEEWFHILNSENVPSIEKWSSLQSRIESNLDKLLTLFDSLSVKVTFFWLGWVAERHKSLVLKCHKAGHEIASHGYSHVLVYKVGQKDFKQDITKAKEILEDITGEQVKGFRAAGFSLTREIPWAFDIIYESGYQYDSSVFPALRAHGGMPESPLGPYFIETKNGHLLEFPMSIVSILGRKISLFGGGYLRLPNKRMIRWGISKLQSSEQPLIIYIHPREIDPNHPRLQLPFIRRFKSYINLKSTLPKLKWLCQNFCFCTMLKLSENYIRSFYLESKTILVVKFRDSRASVEKAPICEVQRHTENSSAFTENRIPLLEKAIANFWSPDVFQSQKTIHNNGQLYICPEHKYIYI